MSPASIDLRSVTRIFISPDVLMVFAFPRSGRQTHCSLIQETQKHRQVPGYAARREPGKGLPAQAVANVQREAKGPIW